MSMINIKMRARVLLGAFTTLFLSAYITYMRNVVTKMTGNPAFVAPVPPLAGITTGLDDLEAKAAKALHGSKEDKTVRDVAFGKSRRQARQLATFVQLTADGDIETLLSSGFSAAGGRGPVVPVNQPLNVRLRQGANSGELEIRFKRHGRNSLTFDVQHGASPNGPFVDHPSVTATRATIAQLTPGTVVWVRVRANGAGGNSDWTSAVSKMVI